MGRKRIIAFIGCSPSLRKAKTELKAKVTDEHCMLAPSQVLVLIQHKLTVWGIVPPTVVWSLLHQLAIKKMSPRLLLS